jgi:hypothetical protein
VYAADGRCRHVARVSAAVPYGVPAELRGGAAERVLPAPRAGAGRAAGDPRHCKRVDRHPGQPEPWRAVQPWLQCPRCLNGAHAERSASASSSNAPGSSCSPFEGRARPVVARSSHRIWGMPDNLSAGQLTGEGAQPLQCQPAQAISRATTPGARTGFQVPWLDFRSGCRRSRPGRCVRLTGRSPADVSSAGAGLRPKASRRCLVGARPRASHRG